MEWRDLAACRDLDPNLFFPGVADFRLGRRAKAVCSKCLVSAACLAEAIALGETGVWGGTTDTDRKRMRRRTAA